MPTSAITGLHVEDIKKHLAMLQKPVNSGNTVVVEHNLDVIKSADWIIDLSCRHLSLSPSWLTAPLLAFPAAANGATRQIGPKCAKGLPFHRISVA